MHLITIEFHALHIKFNSNSDRERLDLNHAEWQLAWKKEKLFYPLETPPPIAHFLVLGDGSTTQRLCLPQNIGLKGIC